MALDSLWLFAVEHVDRPFLERLALARAAARRRPDAIVATAETAAPAGASLPELLQRTCELPGCARLIPTPVGRARPRKFCSVTCYEEKERIRRREVDAGRRRAAGPRESRCLGPECERILRAEGKGRPRAFCSRRCYLASRSARRHGRRAHAVPEAAE